MRSKATDRLKNLPIVSDFDIRYLDLPTGLMDPDRGLRLPTDKGGLECI